MQPNNENIMDWARYYRDIKWNVIPLLSYSKNPATAAFMLPEYRDEAGQTKRGWTPLQTRLSTDEEFRKWFSYPNITGLGVICGKISDLTVVDSDLYLGGEEFISETWLSETTSGGKHFFFKYDSEIPTTGLTENGNRELKSQGGFIVLPPSQAMSKNKTLGKYRWIKKEGDLLEFPKDKIAAFHRNRINPQKISDLAGAKLGTQHNNLRTICDKLFDRFPQDEWSMVEEYIWYLANNFDPPHPEWRIRKMIESAKTFVITNPIKHIKIITGNEEEIGAPKTISQIAEIRKKELVLERNAPKTGFPELDKILKGFVPKRLHTLTGETSIGKTAIACNFAQRLARQNRRTLYLALEPDSSVIDYLASVRLGKTFDELKSDDLDSPGDAIMIYTKEIRTMDALKLVIGREISKFDLFIVDHIGYFIQDRQNWIQETANLIREMALFCNDLLISGIVIAHLRKPEKSKKKQLPSMDDIAGPAAFKQDSDVVMFVSREQNQLENGQIILGNNGGIAILKNKGPLGYVPIIYKPLSAYITTPGEIANPKYLEQFIVSKKEEKQKDVSEPKKQKDELEELLKPEKKLTAEDILKNSNLSKIEKLGKIISEGLYDNKNIIID